MNTSRPGSREMSLPADEVGFEAFRYAAGEMTDDEAAAFEERLALEQPVREALARAVEVSQAVAVLGRQIIPAASGRERAQRGSRRFAVVSVVAAVAACLALAVAIDPFGGPRTGADPDRERQIVQAERPANAARLVALWTDAEDLLGGDVQPSSGTGSSLWGDESGENGVESEFTWMLIAVSAELPLGEAPDSPPEPQEN